MTASYVQICGHIAAVGEKSPKAHVLQATITHYTVLIDCTQCYRFALQKYCFNFVSESQDGYDHNFIKYLNYVIVSGSCF